MTPTFPMIDLYNVKSTFRSAIAKPVVEGISESENAYAERAFVRELMARNPEAIQSDLGLMAMMTQYPRSF